MTVCNSKCHINSSGKNKYMQVRQCLQAEVYINDFVGCCNVFYFFRSDICFHADLGKSVRILVIAKILEHVLIDIKRPKSDISNTGIMVMIRMRFGHIFIYNILHLNVRNLDVLLFKRKIKNVLVDHSFYSLKYRYS